MKKKGPSPASYKTLPQHKKVHGGMFGTGRKGIDFTQVHSQYRGMIAKGLV